jgi:glycosyltransferase involved in cell wall biosynthesis
MFCSTIIPTINRNTLARAVYSVLEQKIPNDGFEIIVVNDSGQPLPKEEWQNFPQVTILETNHRERSAARNAGAAIARGKYLHFLDDDDWMLPDAFLTLSKITSSKSYTWIYGGYKLVDNSGNLLESCQPDEDGDCLVRFFAGEWLPLQASLILSDNFFQVGGFAPLTSLRGGDEDVDLSRKLSFHGEIKGTQETVACIRKGTVTSTTNYSNLSEQSRVSREMVLNYPGAFSRLYRSAIVREIKPRYWKGRVLWFYLTSILWNFQNGKYMHCFSRLLFSAICLLLSVDCWFDKDFYYGATRRHIANGWLRKQI